MAGNNGVPSAEIPSRIARAMASSLHFPMPVSGSGVMLRAYTFKPPSSNRSCPAPAAEVMTGGVALSSHSEWHPMQGITARVRYSPRRKRSGVASNLRDVSGRFLAPMTGRQPTVKVKATAAAANKKRIPYPAIFAEVLTHVLPTALPQAYELRRAEL